MLPRNVGNGFFRFENLGGALMQSVSLPWGESDFFCLDSSTPKAIGGPPHGRPNGGLTLLLQFLIYFHNLIYKFNSAYPPPAT